MLTKIYPEEVSEVLGKHSTVEPVVVVSLVQVLFSFCSVLKAWVFDKNFNAIGLDKNKVTKSPIKLNHK
jgi:hypothetical protein